VFKTGFENWRQKSVPFQSAQEFSMIEDIQTWELVTRASKIYLNIHLSRPFERRSL